ncbi:MAG: glycosyltransferase [Candidatus Hydrothermales bacterium]
MRKFLTGVTVSFNSSKVIFNLINSTERFLGENIEWIFVDSGSKDETTSILKGVKNSSRYFFKKNIGFAKGNNHAISKAKGEYIFFCNPDVSFDKFIFEDVIKELKEKKPLVLIPLLKKKGETFYFIRPLPSIWNVLTLRWNRGKIEKGDRIQPAFSAIFINKIVLDKLKGFDEDFFVYFTDVEFFKRFYEIGFKVEDITFSDKYFYHVGSSVLFLRKYEFLKKFDFARGFLFYFLKYGNLTEKFFSLLFFLILIVRSFFFYFR